MTSISRRCAPTDFLASDTRELKAMASSFRATVRSTRCDAAGHLLAASATAACSSSSAHR